ncbi:hypothetical protein SASPL_152500 [Salvia splendens]|uniref:Nodulin homeobox N-terminal domain-containing protein n=1 Tax=Salvia splendens TaxID=180675 RepID=A0A8X8Z0W5_SALSN|nr:hypothetical protein SASPL_152500 [Salvia splendens]
MNRRRRQQAEDASRRARRFRCGAAAEVVAHQADAAAEAKSLILTRAAGRVHRHDDEDREHEDDRELIRRHMYLLLRIQESHTIPNDMVLLHAALVACSLQLLTVIASPHYQEVAQALTAYYKVYIFKEAAFAAVCVDVKYLQTNDSSRSASPTTEETLNHLWQQCDSSLQFLQPLCQQKLFRECIVNNQVFLDFTLSSD